MRYSWEDLDNQTDGEKDRQAETDRKTDRWTTGEQTDRQKHT